LDKESHQISFSPLGVDDKEDGGKVGDLKRKKKKSKKKKEKKSKKSSKK